MFVFNVFMFLYYQFYTYGNPIEIELKYTYIVVINKQISMFDYLKCLHYHYEFERNVHFIKINIIYSLITKIVNRKV